MIPVITQAWWGDLTEDVCANSIEASRYANSCGYGYLFERFPAVADPLLESDCWRIEQACVRPDMWYWDCDVSGLYRVDFGMPGKPYALHIYPTDGTAIRLPHFSCFYANNCCSYFEDVVAQKRDRGILTVRGWPMKIMRGHPDSCHEIDSGAIVHEFVTSSKSRKAG